MRRIPRKKVRVCAAFSGAKPVQYQVFNTRTRCVIPGSHGTSLYLNKWLENPQAVVKDNDMEFHVANAGEREAVIAYLKSLAN